jgi:hypothetical protein
MFAMIEETMTTFLATNPKCLDTFMNKSLLYEEEDSQSYLKAIESNFASDFTKWLQVSPPAKM